MIRGMPHGAVETFTQSVQPLLLNNCATRGLPRSAVGDGPAALAHCGGQAVEQADHAAESLLRAAIHRPRESSGEQTADRRRRNRTAQCNMRSSASIRRCNTSACWIGPIRLRGRSRRISPSRSRAAARPRSRSRLTRPCRHGCRKTPGKARLLTATARRRTPRDAAAAGKAAKGATPASFDQPADPFDPEGFNRRYGPKQ